jgi:3D (Asp-Asp-Asp) domain-containing protein
MGPRSHRGWHRYGWASAAVLLAVAAVTLAQACARDAREPAVPRARTAWVTATAYNSHPDQTEGDAFVTASGKRLAPGMKVLAVSPDLFEAGLDFGTRVRIDGLDGEWVVHDRMPADRRSSIDLYFGLDEAAAIRFGRKRLRIEWDR